MGYMSLSTVYTVGDMKKIIENLDDDYELFFTAKQRIKPTEASRLNTAIPFYFADVDLDLEAIDGENKEVHFELEVPSEFYYFDN